VTTGVQCYCADHTSKNGKNKYDIIEQNRVFSTIRTRLSIAAGLGTSKPSYGFHFKCCGSVGYHFDADPDPDATYHPDADPDSDFLFDADPGPTFHPDADPDPDPSFKKKAQTYEKVLK
jgi:hypothetical protein